MGLNINWTRALVTGLLVSSVIGCAQGHCRRKKEILPADASVSAELPVDQLAKDSAARVFVYKYDGSLQCGKGKALSVDAMSKQLQGIQIFSSQKKSDGLMHIQVCGSITGMANVYEIPQTAWPAAEAKGFKTWSFE